MTKQVFILEGREVEMTSAPLGFEEWKKLQEKFRLEDRQKPSATAHPIRVRQVQDRLGRNLLPVRSSVKEDLNEAWRTFEDDAQKTPKKGDKK